MEGAGAEEAGDSAVEVEVGEEEEEEAAEEEGEEEVAKARSRRAPTREAVDRWVAWVRVAAKRAETRATERIIASERKGIATATTTPRASRCSHTTTDGSRQRDEREWRGVMVLVAA